MKDPNLKEESRAFTAEARNRNRLTAISAQKLKRPGRHNDGAGLYLLIKPDGRKSWVFRWRDRVSGKHRDKGLGPFWDVSLEQAREAAKRCRELIRSGGDPIEAPRQERQAKRLELARRKTFGECCEAYIEAHRAGWRNEKHAAQWTATLETYAADLYPLPVAEVDTPLVLRCLETIWTTKTETATRVRQRIEAVLDWAAVRGFRTGENPARWRGHMDHLLPTPNKLKKVEHRAAVPYSQVASFMVELRKRTGFSARGLELQILTATRPNEVAGARWPEFDLETGIWTIPGERMKSGKEHRVPLSQPALALLRDLPRIGDYVFPGLRGKKPMSTAAMLKIVKAMRPGMTVHGFRSTFRDWVADCTSYPADMAEFALAHVLKDATVKAYLRADMMEKRRGMMQEWADYCGAASQATSDE